jgi:hypothetical protein
MRKKTLNSLVGPLHLPLTSFHNRRTLQANIASRHSVARAFALENAARAIGQYQPGVLFAEYRKSGAKKPSEL